MKPSSTFARIGISALLDLLVLAGSAMASQYIVLCWKHYKNSTNPANWGQPVAESTFNHVVPGQTTSNFQCF